MRKKYPKRPGRLLAATNSRARSRPTGVCSACGGAESKHRHRRPRKGDEARADLSYNVSTRYIIMISRWVLPGDPDRVRRVRKPVCTYMLL